MQGKASTRHLLILWQGSAVGDSGTGDSSCGRNAGCWGGAGPSGASVASAGSWAGGLFRTRSASCRSFAGAETVLVPTLIPSAEAICFGHVLVVAQDHGERCGAAAG